MMIEIQDLEGVQNKMSSLGGPTFKIKIYKGNLIVFLKCEISTTLVDPIVRSHLMEPL